MGTRVRGSPESRDNEIPFQVYPGNDTGEEEGLTEGVVTVTWTERWTRGYWTRLTYGLLCP